MFAGYVFVDWHLTAKLQVLLSQAGKALMMIDVFVFYFDEEEESSPCQ